MARYIRTLTILFETAINHKEIPLFRGAVLKYLGKDANVLYHNHTGKDTFRYSYPLIQYKRLKGKAAIVCIEDGVDLIGQLLKDMPVTFTIRESEHNFTIEKMVPARLLVQTWDAFFNYHISNWLPLNSRNYLIYQSTTDFKDKIALLENILKGNILSMLKGLKIHLENEIKLSITNLTEPHILYNKGIGMIAFNVDFNCNLSIPNNLGIGKNASIGYGVVCQFKNKNQI